jgi:hypothetical protein
MNTIRMQEPIVCGGRVIVPVVRETWLVVAGGVFAGVSPVALLVGERGEWFFVSVEEGFEAGEIAGASMDGPGSAGGPA